MNVVIVGWGDVSSQLSSLTDSKGNLYSLAVGPTALTGSAPLTQSIYYAKNIAAALAGSNVVTLTFNASVSTPDVRILEYSGLDPINPLDVSSAATGNSASTSSGTALTTNASDLLVSANVVWTRTTGPGSGFIQRMITSPDGDIAQDRVVTAAGSYSSTAPLADAGAWVMQMIALTRRRCFAHSCPDSCSFPYSFPCSFGLPGRSGLCPTQLCDSSVALDHRLGWLSGRPESGRSQRRHRRLE